MCQRDGTRGIRLACASLASVSPCHKLSSVASSFVNGVHFAFS